MRLSTGRFRTVSIQFPTAPESRKGWRRWRNGGRGEAHKPGDPQRLVPTGSATSLANPIVLSLADASLPKLLPTHGLEGSSARQLVFGEPQRVVDVRRGGGCV